MRAFPPSIATHSLDDDEGGRHRSQKDRQAQRCGSDMGQHRDGDACANLDAVGARRSAAFPAFFSAPWNKAVANDVYRDGGPASVDAIRVSDSTRS
ncbi:MAG: hypothetical protein QM674_17090 [Burkholderiaceae bacterium]